VGLFFLTKAVQTHTTSGVAPLLAKKTKLAMPFSKAYDIILEMQEGRTIM